MTQKNKFTIVTKLWLLSGLLIATILVCSAFGAWNVRSEVADLEATVNVDVPALRAAGALDMMHDGIRGNTYHAIILSGSKSEKDLQDVRDEGVEFAKNIREDVKKLQNLPIAPDARQRLESAVPKVEAYVIQAEKVRGLALAGKTAAAMAEVPVFDARFKELEGELDVLGNLLDEYDKQWVAASQQRGQRAIQISIILGIAGTILGLLLAFALIRDLKRVLRRVITDLATESSTVTVSSQSLSNAAQGLSSATAQQASALQETAASIDEITAMVKKTSDNSKQLEQSTQLSNLSAGRGKEAVGHMLQSMKTIADANTKMMNQVEDGNVKITEIVKVIGEIGNKTKVINDIVFQTKLLSFNASVEAARAGEHGKGFAVVAEEVGNLAQMSGNAAKEISEMLSTSLSRVENIVAESKKRVEVLFSEGKETLATGSSVARQCGDALDDIVKHSSGVASMVTEISTAIEEQNQGIHEISKAIQLLDQATHQNAVTSTETSHTSGNLLQQASSLRAIVLTLEQMVTGEGEAAAPVAAPAAAAAPVISLEGKRAKARTAPAMVGSKAVGGGSVPLADDPRFQDL